MANQYTNTPLDVRFWARVQKSREDKCWLWQGSVNKDGYGRLQVGPRGANRMWAAHRLAYALHNGPIPDGLWVLHHCDNPPCCNPAHLFLGTLADNHADMDSKGRRPHGEAHWMKKSPERIPRGDQSFSRKHPERIARGERCRHAKLTAAVVQEMRRLYAEGSHSYKQIANRFGVNKRTAIQAIKRRTWAHV